MAQASVGEPGAASNLTLSETMLLLRAGVSPLQESALSAFSRPRERAAGSQLLGAGAGAGAADAAVAEVREPA